MEESNFDTDIFQLKGGERIVKNNKTDEIENNKIRQMIKDMYQKILNSEIEPMNGGATLDLDKDISSENTDDSDKSDRIILPDSSSDESDDTIYDDSTLLDTTSETNKDLKKSKTNKPINFSESELKATTENEISYDDSDTSFMSRSTSVQTITSSNNKK